MDAVLPQLRVRPKSSWRGESIDARQSYMEHDMFVMHPALVRWLQEIKRRMIRALRSRKGLALFLVSPSGGGKSHFVKMLKKIWPNEESDALTRVRLASFSVPPVPSAATMPRALLEGMGVPCWNIRDGKEAMDRALGFIEDTQFY